MGLRGRRYGRVRRQGFLCGLCVRKLVSSFEFRVSRFEFPVDWWLSCGSARRAWRPGGRQGGVALRLPLPQKALESCESCEWQVLGLN